MTGVEVESATIQSSMAMDNNNNTYALNCTDGINDGEINEQVIWRNPGENMNVGLYIHAYINVH